MGGVESSQLTEIPPGFEYMCIVINKPDGVRVVHGGDRELSIIKEAIEESWKMGFDANQKSKCHGYVQSFKLSGIPFDKGSPQQYALEARKMFSQILWKLNNAGWKLLMTTDLSRKMAFGTFFFVKQETFSISYPFPCINISSSDKLQFINFSQNLYPSIKGVIEENWSPGIQFVYTEDEHMLDVQLFGDPWKGMGRETVEARSLIQKLIEFAAKNQLALCCSANIKNTADSLFFKHEPRFESGIVAPFVTISLNRDNRLRLINAKPELVPVVRKVIEDAWGWRKGIKNEGDYFGSFEFELHGSPWWSIEKESIMARYLIAKLLEAMQGHGWHAVGAFDVSRRMSNKSVLIFQQSAPLSTPIMCLSPSSTDKLRLINAPPDVIQDCREIITKRWPKGINNEKEKQTELGVSCVQFTLNGTPWDGENDDKYYVRSMLCFILQALTQKNWKVIVSGDVSAKYKEDDDVKFPTDVHSWWLMQLDPSATLLDAPPPYDSVMGKY